MEVRPQLGYLTQEQQNYLTAIYHDPSNPASFQTPRDVFDVVNQDNTHNLTFKQVQRWVSNQDSYSKHKRVYTNFARNRVVVKGIDDQWDADLAQLNKFSPQNDGVKYLLCIIDIFSRFAWVVPMLDKFQTTITPAFEQVLFDSGRKPDRLRTDAATDFTAAAFQAMCTRQRIRHFTTSGEKQANYVERFIQTLKSRIYRYLIQKNTLRYIDDLQALVHSYNVSFHSGIQMEPAYVNAQNEKVLWWQMYLPNEFFTRENPPKFRRKPFGLDIGDHVRISQTLGRLSRKYDQKWTSEVFQVSERFHRYEIPIYKLKDIGGEPVKGTFYGNELQKIDFDLSENALGTVEKIIKHRGRGRNRQALVKWLDWPKKFNSWVLVSDIMNI